MRVRQYAGYSSSLATSGNDVTMELFDQNLILAYAHDRRVRGFYNICSRRRHQPIEGAGKTWRLVCSCHTWPYALAGQLSGVPPAKGTATVTKSEICLSEARVE